VAEQRSDPIGRTWPAIVAAIVAAMTLALGLAARAQDYGDEYRCHHGNPADGRTAAACDRLGEPIPTVDDRLREARLRPPPPPPPPPQALPQQPAPPFGAPSPIDGSADFQRGQADRLQYEAWRRGLLGDFRAGASWAETHGGEDDCRTGVAAATAEWRAGCTGAQAELSLSNAARRASPEYDRGWTSVQSDVPPATASAPVQPAASESPRPGPAPDAANATTPAPQKPGLSGTFLALVVAGIFGVLVCLALYFVPTMIAASRRKQNVLAIFLLNLCLGWTLIGWIVALTWSLYPEPSPPLQV
jgi:hypothetical protein